MRTSGADISSFLVSFFPSLFQSLPFPKASLTPSNQGECKCQDEMEMPWLVVLRPTGACRDCRLVLTSGCGTEDVVQRNVKHGQGVDGGMEWPWHALGLAFRIRQADLIEMRVQIKAPAAPPQLLLSTSSPSSPIALHDIYIYTYLPF